MTDLQPKAPAPTEAPQDEKTLGAIMLEAARAREQSFADLVASAVVVRLAEDTTTLEEIADLVAARLQEKLPLMVLDDDADGRPQVASRHEAAPTSAPARVDLGKRSDDGRVG